MSNLTEAHNLIEQAITKLEVYQSTDGIVDITADLWILKRKLADIIW